MDGQCLSGVVEGERDCLQINWVGAGCCYFGRDFLFQAGRFFGLFIIS